MSTKNNIVLPAITAIISEIAHEVKSGNKEKADSLLIEVWRVCHEGLNINEHTAKLQVDDECLFKLTAEMKELRGRITGVRFCESDDLRFDIELWLNPDEGEIANIKDVSSAYVFPVDHD